MLLRSKSEDEQTQVQAILTYLQGEGVAARIKSIATASASAVIRAVQEEDASQLVVSRTSSIFADQSAEALLSELNLPITVTP